MAAAGEKNGEDLAQHCKGVDFDAVGKGNVSMARCDPQDHKHIGSNCHGSSVTVMELIASHEIEPVMELRSRKA